MYNSLSLVSQRIQSVRPIKFTCLYPSRRSSIAEASRLQRMFLDLQTFTGENQQTKSHGTTMQISANKLFSSITDTPFLVIYFMGKITPCFRILGCNHLFFAVIYCAFTHQRLLFNVQMHTHQSAGFCDLFSLDKASRLLHANV